jgi:hypothetical protein
MCNLNLRYLIILVFYNILILVILCFYGFIDFSPSVYQSVIQTCSHDLAFDADNLPNQSLITYRAYLPLWRHLLSRTETLCGELHI